MTYKLIVKPVLDGYVATFERGVGCFGYTREEAIKLVLDYQPKRIPVAYDNDEPISIPVRSIQPEASN